MSAWLLALAAAAQAPPTPPDYFASGSEPFWGLEIRGRHILFSPNDDSEADEGITAALPRRRPAPGGYRLVTPRFTVSVRHRACQDEAERRYRDTVTVRLGGRSYLGCGGPYLPPLALERTDWRILRIDNMTIDDNAYVMGFYEGRITAQAGCNRLSGAFRQRGATFTAGPIAATRMACPGARMTHERLVLRLLGGPVRISFPAGNAMVLTGSGVTIRLQQT